MEPGTEMVAVGRGRGAKSESECAGASLLGPGYHSREFALLFPLAH